MRLRSKVFWAGILLFAAVSASHALERSSLSNLERFVDGIMQRSIIMQESAGATVALVQDGRLLFARGYGLADVTGQVPVQGRLTPFRIGSISKIFVWIAVLQQVEAGRLDLDADVNQYLTEFKLPPDFSAPITLRHLMTHTAGFEDNLVDLFVSGPRQLGELEDRLAKQIPERVRLPGNLVAYSNYGAALAGYLVALVSGLEWDDYVETHILRPLKMESTTTRQPLPDRFENRRAKGYLKTPAGFVEQGFMYVPLAPAGSATATALDMAKLMAELLNPQGTQVLSSQSKALLFGGAYLSHPKVNGVTLGLYEMSLGTPRAVGHDGSTLLFNSQLIMWPEERLGLFVSTNTLGGETVAATLVQTLASHLGLTETNATLTDVTNAAPYLGRYISARRNHSNFSKLLGLTDTVWVKPDANGQSLVVQDASGERIFKQLSPHVFQALNSPQRLAFKLQQIGPQELYMSNRPVVAYQRVTLATDPLLNAALVVVYMILALAVIVLWPISSLTHRGWRTEPGQRVLSLLVFGSACVGVFFFIQLANSAGSAFELMFGGMQKIAPLLWLPFGWIILLGLQLVYAVRAWLNGYWWVSRRLYFVLFLVVQLALAWWFWYWNLLPQGLLGWLK